MAILSDLRGTIDTFFQFGLSGMGLRSASSKLECRNAANTDYADFVAAEITGRRPISTVTGSKTLAIADSNTFQNVTSASAITITIPVDATVNFPVGTEIEITQDNTGSVTIAQEDSGVNIRRYNSVAVTGHTLLGRYAACMLKKIAPNEWRVYGGF